MRRIASYLPPSLTVLLCSCAFNVYVNHQKDPDWNGYKKEQVMVFLSQPLSIEDKKLKREIERKLIGKDVILVDSEPDLILAITQDNDQGSYSSTLFLPQISNTSGNVGGIGYNEQTTSTQAIPYTQNYNFKKIYMNLFTKEAVANYQSGDKSNSSPIWEGFCSVSNSDFDKYREKVLEACLENIFRDFKGDKQIPY